MGSKVAVITRPSSDLTTRYLSYWAQEVLAEAKAKSHRVIDLKGERANQKEFRSVVTKKRPHLIFLNGHGGGQFVCGQDNQVLVEAGKNEGDLRGAITYALACKSAAGLGSASVAAGAPAYIGYKEDFIFAYDIQKQTKPHHDQTARLFLEPASRVPQALFKGNTVAQSCERARSAFRKNIRRLLTSEVAAEDSSMLRFLFWDMQHLVAHGDQAARL